VRVHDGDGQADFYENFGNPPAQTADTRELPMEMVVRPEGGFKMKAASCGVKDAATPCWTASAGPHSAVAGALEKTSLANQAPQLLAQLFELDRLTLNVVKERYDSGRSHAKTGQEGSPCDA
jgi:hypothetical protein